MPRFTNDNQQKQYQSELLQLATQETLPLNLQEKTAQIRPLLDKIVPQLKSCPQGQRIAPVDADKCMAKALELEGRCGRFFDNMHRQTREQDIMAMGVDRFKTRSTWLPDHALYWYYVAMMNGKAEAKEKMEALLQRNLVTYLEHTKVNSDLPDRRHDPFDFTSVPVRPAAKGKKPLCYRTNELGYIAMSIGDFLINRDYADDIGEGSIVPDDSGKFNFQKLPDMPPLFGKMWPVPPETYMDPAVMYFMADIMRRDPDQGIYRLLTDISEYLMIQMQDFDDGEPVTIDDLSGFEMFVQRPWELESDHTNASLLTLLNYMQHGYIKPGLLPEEHFDYLTEGGGRALPGDILRTRDLMQISPFFEGLVLMGKYGLQEGGLIPGMPAQAAYMIGLAYLHGENLPQDTTKASMWLHYASVLGHPDAMLAFHLFGDCRPDLQDKYGDNLLFDCCHALNMALRIDFDRESSHLVSYDAEVWQQGQKYCTRGLLVYNTLVALLHWRDQERHRQDESGISDFSSDGEIPLFSILVSAFFRYVYNGSKLADTPLCDGAIAALLSQEIHALPEFPDASELNPVMWSALFLAERADMEKSGVKQEYIPSRLRADLPERGDIVLDQLCLAFAHSAFAGGNELGTEVLSAYCAVRGEDRSKHAVKFRQLVRRTLESGRPVTADVLLQAAQKHQLSLDEESHQALLELAMKGSTVLSSQVRRLREGKEAELFKMLSCGDITAFARMAEFYRDKDRRMACTLAFIARSFWCPSSLNDLLGDDAPMLPFWENFRALQKKALQDRDFESCVNMEHLLRMSCSFSPDFDMVGFFENKALAAAAPEDMAIAWLMTTKGRTADYRRDMGLTYGVLDKSQREAAEQHLCPAGSRLWSEDNPNMRTSDIMSFPVLDNLRQGTTWLEHLQLCHLITKMHYVGVVKLETRPEGFAFMLDRQSVTQLQDDPAIAAMFTGKLYPLLESWPHLGSGFTGVRQDLLPLLLSCLKNLASRMDGLDPKLRWPLFTFIQGMLALRPVGRAPDIALTQQLMKECASLNFAPGKALSYLNLAMFDSHEHNKKAQAGQAPVTSGRRVHDDSFIVVADSTAQ